MATVGGLDPDPGRVACFGGIPLNLGTRGAEIVMQDLAGSLSGILTLGGNLATGF